MNTSCTQELIYRYSLITHPFLFLIPNTLQPHRRTSCNVPPTEHQRRARWPPQIPPAGVNRTRAPALALPGNRRSVERVAVVRCSRTRRWTPSAPMLSNVTKCLINTIILVCTFTLTRNTERADPYARTRTCTHVREYPWGWCTLLEDS